MKYDYLVVDLTMGSNVQYAIYETKEAKRNFKSNGDIDACCGNNKCSVYSKSWFFCGSINTFYSKFDGLKLNHSTHYNRGSVLYNSIFFDNGRVEYCLAKINFTLWC